MSTDEDQELTVRVSAAVAAALTDKADEYNAIRQQDSDRAPLTRTDIAGLILETWSRRRDQGVISMEDLEATAPRT